jgi:hypothetical protein
MQSNRHIGKHTALVRVLKFEPMACILSKKWLKVDAVSKGTRVQYDLLVIMQAFHLRLYGASRLHARLTRQSKARSDRKRTHFSIEAYRTSDLQIMFPQC